MVEEVVEAFVGEGRGITGSRGGDFVDTSTPATIEVGLVIIPARTGSTTSVEDVVLVITLSPVVAKTGGVREITVISPTDSAGSDWFRISHLFGHL